MRPVRSEQWAASLVFDVPFQTELCNETFAPHPARRTALLQNPSACADARALHLRRNARMDISSASLMQHLARFPFAQTVELTNLMLNTRILRTLRHPVSASVSKLVIRVRDQHDSTDALFGMLPDLPGLRVLELHGVWPTAAGDDSPPALSPLSLEAFTCSGIISLPACARIVEGSARTLRALRVTGLEWYPDTPALRQLTQVLIGVAPALREFALSLPDSGAFRTSLDALCLSIAHARTIRFEGSIHHVLWDLARRLCPAFCGHLELSRTVARNRPPMLSRTQVDDDFLVALGSAKFRSLAVSRFRIEGESKEELLELCGARRIQCALID